MTDFHSLRLSVADKRLDEQGKMPTMATVTVNVDGRPVGDVITEQVADEVREVRESENKFKIHKSARTTGIRNHSGEKTAAGMALYMGDPKATHILCAGSFWPIEEKRPFEPAGKSCFGAVEFCEATQEFKCHECGQWVLGLGPHVQHHHKQFSSFRDYKMKSGLSLNRGVASPTVMARKSEHAKKAKLGVATRFASTIKKESQEKATATRRFLYSTRGEVESAVALNLFGLCRAQTIRDLKEFCAALGRTPTAEEMRQYTNANGYHSLLRKRIRRLFGSRSGFFACAGVPMRTVGAVLNRPKKVDKLSTLQKSVWANMSAEVRERRLASLAMARQKYRDSVTQ